MVARLDAPDVPEAAFNTRLFVGGDTGMVAAHAEIGVAHASPALRAHTAASILHVVVPLYVGAVCAQRRI